MRYALDERGEFAKHYQSGWLRLAETAPHKWLKVACLAYGMHRNNGHTPLKRGELAALLGPPGEPLDRRRVLDAVMSAVDHGWLAPGSDSMCLIVPPEHIEKGRPDSMREPCPVHLRRARRSAK